MTLIRCCLKMRPLLSSWRRESGGSHHNSHVKQLEVKGWLPDWGLGCFLACQLDLKEIWSLCAYLKHVLLNHLWLAQLVDNLSRLTKVAGSIPQRLPLGYVENPIARTLPPDSGTTIGSNRISRVPDTRAWIPVGQSPFQKKEKNKKETFSVWARVGCPTDSHSLTFQLLVYVHIGLRVEGRHEVSCFLVFIVFSYYLTCPRVLAYTMRISGCVPSVTASYRKWIPCSREHMHSMYL